MKSLKPLSEIAKDSNVNLEWQNGDLVINNAKVKNEHLNVFNLYGESVEHKVVNESNGLTTIEYRSKEVTIPTICFE